MPNLHMDRCANCTYFSRDTNVTRICVSSCDLYGSWGGWTWLECSFIHIKRAQNLFREGGGGVLLWCHDTHRYKSMPLSSVISKSIYDGKYMISCTFFDNSEPNSVLMVNETRRFSWYNPNLGFKLPELMVPTGSFTDCDSSIKNANGSVIKKGSIKVLY